MLIAHLRGIGPEEQDLSDLEAFYVKAKKRWKEDESFAAQARETVVKLQSGDPDTLAAWRTLVDKTRECYLPIYRRLGVLLTPEDERGESFYNDLLSSVVSDL
jgi:arginyl-tRNA synthetase